MGKRAKSICNYPGCYELISKPGYCKKHLFVKKESFKQLDGKKTPEQKRFYSSYAWTKTSKQHRRIEPLCRECYDAGRIVEGNLVHHTPELQTLWDRGLNPLDHEYLSTICLSCHQKHLRAKRK